MTDPALVAAASPLIPLAEVAQQLADVPSPRAVVLVEGLSDLAAVRAAARLLGRDLPAEGVLAASMGGATNLGRFLTLFGPAGLDMPIVVLCDAGEADDIRRQLRTAARSELQVCTADLEDELIRALGTDHVVDIVTAQGDLRAFQSLQKQPEWRAASVAAQLRRFLGSGAGRKVRYGGLLTAALEPGALIDPLAGVLRSVGQ